jgi:hypothetical protein
MSLTVIKSTGIDTSGNYTVNSMTVSANLVAGNLRTNNLQYANGSPYVFTSNAGGTNTQIQFNDANTFAGSANLTFDKTTNTFSTGNINSYNINVTGNIIPSSNNTFSLGSEDFYFKDVYIGPGSLYINGQKVLEQTDNTIVVSADPNKILRLSTSGTGSIELFPEGTGVVAIDGTLRINGTKSITSSDGNKIKFGNPIGVNEITSLTANGQLVLTGDGTGNVKVDDDLLVTGNLTVQGNTANLSVNHLVVQDNIIDINAETTGVPNAQINSGIRVIRGDSPSVVLRWTEDIDNWQFTNDGTNFLSIVGKDSSGNTNLGTNAIATNFIGNGSQLTGITATTATTAATVTTNAQPNITSVGLLTSLSVGPNSSITLTGTSGFVKANSIQGVDGVNAIFPGYNSVSGSVGVLTDLTIGTSGTGNLSVPNVTTTGSLRTNNLQYANGSPYVFTSNASGANTQVQFNDGNNFAGSANLTFDKTTNTLTVTNFTSSGVINFTSASNVSLGNVSNVKVTGGTNGQLLSTDGAGNLSWSSVSGGATITDDTTTNSVYYPVYATSSSGSLTTAGITTTKLQFVPSTGQLTVQDLNTLSDMTLKENTEVINDPFTVLSQLFGVSFTWVDSGKKSYGLLAQMLENVLPELVSTNAQGKKTVNYIPIIAFLIEAVKKQQQDIDELKKR